MIVGSKVVSPQGAGIKITTLQVSEDYKRAMREAFGGKPLRREAVTPQERRAARVRAFPWGSAGLTAAAVVMTLAGFGESLGVALCGMAFGLTFKH